MINGNYSNSRFYDSMYCLYETNTGYILAKNNENITENISFDECIIAMKNDINANEFLDVKVDMKAPLEFEKKAL